MPAERRVPGRARVHQDGQAGLQVCQASPDFLAQAGRVLIDCQNIEVQTGSQANRVNRAQRRPDLKTSALQGGFQFTQAPPGTVDTQNARGAHHNRTLSKSKLLKWKPKSRSKERISC